MITDERRAMLLDRWPSLSLPLFAGKTPLEAAADPANRVRLLAAILVLEASEANPAMAEHVCRAAQEARLAFAAGD